MHAPWDFRCIKLVHELEGWVHWGMDKQQNWSVQVHYFVTILEHLNKNVDSNSYMTWTIFFIIFICDKFVRHFPKKRFKYQQQHTIITHVTNESNLRDAHACVSTVRGVPSYAKSNCAKINLNERYFPLFGVSSHQIGYNIMHVPIVHGVHMQSVWVLPRPCLFIASATAHHHILKIVLRSAIFKTHTPQNADLQHTCLEKCYL